MSHFKAKMHQIRFPLGLRPRPRWGSLQCSPRPLYLRGLLLKGRRGRGEEGMGREEGGKGRRGRGLEGNRTTQNLVATPLLTGCLRHFCSVVSLRCIMTSLLNSTSPNFLIAYLLALYMTYTPCLKIRIFCFIFAVSLSNRNLFL